jgi:nitroreductase
MSPAMNQQENRVLDEVIARRRSIRVFKPEAPPDEWIEQIILSGLQAPYAGLAAKQDVPYRLFRVIRQGPIMNRAQELIKKQARTSLDGFRAEMESNPYLRQHGATFAKRLEVIMEHGIPSLKDAPFFIVVAERKGIPPVEFESLAHCLENMWLKATALGLGFQLLSVTKVLSEDPQFFDLVDLGYGQFLLNGCAVGYPQHEPPAKHLFPITEVLKWI